MENQKLVSIIIPVYNVETYLKRCLDSIIGQTYTKIEIICVNDGSTDNSLGILNNYKTKDSRFVVINKENGGVSLARNSGIKMANGEYICFVDSDDWLELNMVETLTRTIEEKEVDAVRCNYYNNYIFESNYGIGGMGSLKNTTLNTKEQVKDSVTYFLNGDIDAYVMCLMIKRESILKTQLFDEEIFLMEDKLFYIDLLCNISSIYFIELPLYHYFQNLNSRTKSGSYYLNNLDNALLVNEKTIKIMNKYGIDNNKNMETLKNKNCIIIANILSVAFKSSDNNLLNYNSLVSICQRKEIVDIFEGSKINNVQIHIKIPTLLIKYKKYKMLFLFYKIRGRAAKFKNRLLNK